MTEAYVSRCVQTAHMTKSEFESLLWKKALRWGSVFSVEKLNGIYIDGLKTRIRQNVWAHWTSHPDVKLSEITRYAKSVASRDSKGNEPTKQHTSDAVNRGCRGGRTALTV